MIKSSVEKLSETIGFEIGASDDITQANLLNGFCKGLANSMDSSTLDTQICSIVNSLNPKSQMVIKIMTEFIKLKEEDQ